MLVCFERPEDATNAAEIFDGTVIGRNEVRAEPVPSNQAAEGIGQSFAPTPWSSAISIYQESRTYAEILANLWAWWNQFRPGAGI